MGAEIKSQNFAGIYRNPISLLVGTDRTMLLNILLDCKFKDDPDFTLRDGTIFPLKRGQLITSIKRLGEISGLSDQQVRTAIKRLKKRQIINSASTKELTKKATLISLINTDLFLHSNSVATKALTKKQQTGNKSSTIYKNDKKEKKEKELYFGIDKSIPQYLDPDLWKSYMEVRCKAKAPKTDNALKLVLQEIVKLKAQGNDPNEILKQSIMNGWKGVFPLKHQKNKINNHTNFKDKNYENGSEGFVTRK